MSQSAPVETAAGRGANAREAQNDLKPAHTYLRIALLRGDISKLVRRRIADCRASRGECPRAMSAAVRLSSAAANHGNFEAAARASSSTEYRGGATVSGCETVPLATDSSMDEDDSCVERSHTL